MGELTQAEFDLLDKFLRAVHEQIREGKIGKYEGLEIMRHPIHAYQKRDPSSVRPFMEEKLKEWGKA